MENITSSAGLKNTIQILEAEHAVNGQLLREQFKLTYENFKPVNLLIGSMKDFASSPNLLNNLLGTGMGLATGYLSRKIFIGASGNLIRKLIGSLLQVGVTSVVARHPETVKSIGQIIFDNLLHKRETNSVRRDS